MAVYADVLIVVNYITNLLLLLASAKILGVIVSRKRICMAALVGAIGSLIIFLPYIGFWFQFIYKLVLAFAMTAVAFGCKSRKHMLKALFVTFTVSFIFAGLMLAASFALAPVGMIFYNGVVYFDISALTLIICTTAAYLLLLLFERIFFSRISEKKLYDLTVTVNGKTISLKGLADTGSNLKEPFSGAPVIVCDRTLAQRIKPEKDTGFRIIPCLTVTGEGALEGFRPDKIFITGGGKSIQTSDVYIAASREPITGEYQALINPQLIDMA
ncbi:sigma-E processing peptidase SpoIIGA [Oscillospiraceae bacterium PP1C4]